MNIIELNVEDIKEYENNAKIHTNEQIQQIVDSINEFGFNDPIAVDENNVIIEGHGRYLAVKKLGLKTIPAIKLEHFTDLEKKAYIIAHNKINLNTGFDFNPFEEDDVEELELEDYEDEPTIERKVICPNCGYTDYIKNFTGVPDE